MSFININFVSLHEADEDEADVKIKPVENEEDNNEDNNNQPQPENDEDDYNLNDGEEVDEDDYDLPEDGEEDTEDTGDEDDYNLDDGEETDEDDYDLPDDNEENNEPTTGDEDDYNLDDDTDAGDNTEDGDDYNLDTNPDDTEEDAENEDEVNNTDEDSVDTEDEEKTLSAQIADIEDRIYEDLSDDEKLNRIMELKGNCTKIYSDCTDIIEQISSVVKTSQNQEVIERVIEGLVRLKQYTLDYMTNSFDSKTYSENKDWYDKAKTFMVSVRNVLDELVKQNEKNNKAEARLEAALSSKTRNKLKDSTFGIPKLRKFPLNDKAHVKAAIRFFDKAPEKHKKELSLNIRKAAEKFNIKIAQNSKILNYK